MVIKWLTEFRCDLTTTSDPQRSGRPIELANPETIE